MGADVATAALTFGGDKTVPIASFCSLKRKWRKDCFQDKPTDAAHYWEESALQTLDMF
jgi:hypothetical protein